MTSVFKNDDPCPYCSFQPTNFNDYCSDHKPTIIKPKTKETSMKKSVKDIVAPEGYVFVKEGSLQEMADNIKQISSAVNRFHGPGKLNRSGLSILIREGTRSTGPVIDIKEINRVLDSLAALEKRYIVPEAK